MHLPTLTLPEINAPSSVDMFKHKGENLPSVLPKDPEQEWFYTDTYYPIYYKVIYKALTEQILTFVPILFEIGVRSGYIAIVFKRVLEALDKQGYYIGLDNSSYEVNGINVTSQSLDLLGLDYDLFEQDSKEFNYKPFNNLPNIIHIDGEHTREAKLIDMRASFAMVKQGGYLLIDDYDHHIVRAAIFEYLEELQNSHELYEVYHCKTYRGMVVIKKL